MLVFALLVAAGAWAYSTSFRGAYVWDDLDAIVRNPHVRALPAVADAASAPSDTTLAGRPVASLTFAANYALTDPGVRDAFQPEGNPPYDLVRDPFFRNVWGYHATNLGVHVLAALALFLVSRQTLRTDAVRARLPLTTGAATGLSAVAALVWLLHPLQTSAVTYVVQRVESLMGLFYLATIYAAIRATEPARLRRGWLAIAILSCALGMATKESMVSAPVLVALWLWCFRPEALRRDRGGVVLIGALAATWVIVIGVLVSGVRSESVGAGLGGWTPVTYLLTQIQVVTHYLRLAFWPSPLVFSYDWPPVASITAIWWQLPLLAALLAASGAAAWRRHPLGFVGAAVFLILAPTSSVVPIATEVAAEHRMYLPLAPIAVACVGAGYALVRQPVFLRLAATAFIVALAAALGARTRDRNIDYWTSEALLKDTIAKQPHHARVRAVLGAELLSAGRFADAERELREAVSGASAGRLGPNTAAIARMYLGSALSAQGRYDEGIPLIEAALAANASLDEAHGILAEAYAGQGRHAEAAAAFDRAIERLPSIPAVLNRAAWLRATSFDPAVRDGAKAVEFAERAVSLTGRRDAGYLLTLGAAYARAGRFPDALAAVDEARARAVGVRDYQLLAELDAQRASYVAGRALVIER